MARINLNPIITDVRGTIGDKLTFQSRGSGHYVIKKPIPRNPQSTLQTEQRTKFLDARDAWLALSPEDKTGWKEEARAIGGTSGYALFIQNYLLTPPQLPMFDALFAHWSAARGVFELSTNEAATPGALVTRWEDAIGGYVFTQSSSSRCPTFLADGGEGFPALSFNSDYMNWSSALPHLGNNPRTLALLLRREGSSVNQGVMTLDYAAGLGTGYDITTEVGVRVTAGNTMYENDPISMSNFDVLVVTNPVNASTNNTEASLNGVVLTPSSINSRALNTDSDTVVRIGRTDQGGSLRYGDVSIAALAIWTDYMNAATRAEVTAELLLQ